MNDDELAALLNGPPPERADPQQDEEPSDRIQQGLKKARTSQSQKETLGFVLVSLWATLAKVLAPLFAGLAKRHASHLTHQQTSSHSNGGKNGHP